MQRRTWFIPMLGNGLGRPYGPTSLPNNLLCLLLHKLRNIKRLILPKGDPRLQSFEGNQLLRELFLRKVYVRMVETEADHFGEFGEFVEVEAHPVGIPEGFEQDVAVAHEPVQPLKQVEVVGAPRGAVGLAHL
jgi:hypothetical protein